MSSNVVFFGWNRPVPGREARSGELFQEFVGYLTGLQQEGTIASFEPVFLGAHGGDLNGFFLIRGEPAKLDAMVASDAWVKFLTLAGINLEGAGVVRGAVGDLLMAQMALWTSLISQ